ncbi:MAG: redox-sensing transcriptional repressor Rex [Candidatus Omnitrophica bacterium]|nr:redox-sensing transcriptional repressor Rex [Candidatus Omnitrophota bacterium]
MSKHTIIRLSRYKNALYRFESLGFVKVFSDNLADAIGVTPSQVRKDFSMFGLSGNKRGGYKVDELLAKLNEILGTNKAHNVIVAGAGNLGSALIKYKGFEKENIKITAAFDIDHSKGERAGEIPVKPFDEMQEYVRQNDIRVGIIAVPDMAAQHVADVMMAGGIKGILNFAPIRLRVDEGIVVNNVNLALELENIIYFICVPMGSGKGIK